jgi:hypothetical protein
MNYCRISDMEPGHGRPERGSKIYRSNFSGPTLENSCMKSFKIASNFAKIPPSVVSEAFSFSSPASVSLRGHTDQGNNRRIR